jgi:hypothetical protein
MDCQTFVFFVPFYFIVFLRLKSQNMFNKFLFLTILIALCVQSCTSNSKSTPTNGQSSVETTSNKTVVAQAQTEAPPQYFPCATMLKSANPNNLQKIYSDTLTFDNKRLLFVTRDSALHVFQQKDQNCTLLLKIPIDSTDLYSYQDGSPLVLTDIDGDGQKDVFVTIEKNKGHSQFRVYRLAKENEHLVLKKIRRFEALVNPEFDKTTGLVRSHWYDRDDYEMDESYRISKDGVLTFVKGFESKRGKEKRYETKAGW